MPNHSTNEQHESDLVSWHRPTWGKWMSGHGTNPAEWIESPIVCLICNQTKEDIYDRRK